MFVNMIAYYWLIFCSFKKQMVQTAQQTSYAFPNILFFICIMTRLYLSPVHAMHAEKCRLFFFYLDTENRYFIWEWMCNVERNLYDRYIYISSCIYMHGSWKKFVGLNQRLVHSGQFRVLNTFKQTCTNARILLLRAHQLALTTRIRSIWLRLLLRLRSIFPLGLFDRLSHTLYNIFSVVFLNRLQESCCYLPC